MNTFPKEVGTEEKSRNVFRYILTSGHEGTHSIPTEQMGALVTRSLRLTLLIWLEDRLVTNTERPETLVSFTQPLLTGSCRRGPQALGQTCSSTWTQRAYLTWKMNGKLTSIQSSFVQEDVRNKLKAAFRTAQKLCYIWLAIFWEHWKKYGSTFFGNFSKEKVFSPGGFSEYFPLIDTKLFWSDPK